MKLFNLHLKAKLSKKQCWEMSQLDIKDQFKYLLSFSTNNNFHAGNYDNNFNYEKRGPLTKMRSSFHSYNRHNDLRNGIMPILRSRIQRRRFILLNKLSTAQLKALVG